MRSGSCQVTPPTQLQRAPVTSASSGTGAPGIREPADSDVPEPRDFGPCPQPTRAPRLRRMSPLLVGGGSHDRSLGVSMTDSVALAGVLRRTTPSTVRRSPGVRIPVGPSRTVHDLLSPYFRTLSTPIPRRAASAPLDRRCGSADDARVALAAAVRQQLSKPGSVPPQRQLQLILADRLVRDDDPDSPVPDRCHWSPFLESFDVNPYRPLARIDGASENPNRSYPWWDRPVEDFSALSTGRLAARDLRPGPDGSAVPKLDGRSSEGF